MKTWKACGIAVAVGAGFAGQINAQPGGTVPPAPVAPASSTVVVTKTTTVWDYLGLTAENHAECKKAFCLSGFGQMFSNMGKPLTKFTGGIIPSCCPDIGDLTNLTPAQKALLTDPAEKAALAIQASEANAKARRAAVRYLGTVDCHWWKADVEDALIHALRVDRNECVRWEAAMALMRGCCCTKRIIERLAIVVSQSSDDDCVSENSPRVIEAARIALEHCLVCQKPEVKKKAPEKNLDTPKPPPVMDNPRGEAPTEKNKDGTGDPEIGRAVATEEDAKSGVKLSAFDLKVEKKSMAEVVKNAQAVLEQANRRYNDGFLPSGRQGLLDIAASTLGASPVPAEVSGMPYAGDPTNPSPNLVDRVKQVMPDAFPEEYARANPNRTIKPGAAVVVSQPSTGSGGLLDRMARAIMPYAIQDTRPIVMNDTYTRSDLKSMPVMASTPSWREPSQLPKPPVTPSFRENVAAPLAEGMNIPTSTNTTQSPKIQENAKPARSFLPPSTTPLPTPPVASGAVVQTSIPTDRAVTVTVRTSADRVIQYLQDDTYSRLRDFALDGFRPTDAESAAKALPAILKAGREDASAKVRGACARCLGRIGQNTPEVLATLEQMKSDADANVRREVILALGRLQLTGKSSATTASDAERLP